MAPQWLTILAAPARPDRASARTAPTRLIPLLVRARAKAKTALARERARRAPALEGGGLLQSMSGGSSRISVM
ncbi:hypothetical protein PENSPDRAFT_647520 [Peniophora sp. CONT]|nr:hypothetical protein PENSPDRAFT_647520 [Peniophora sp. CONT]